MSEKTPQWFEDLSLAGTGVRIVEPTGTQTIAGRPASVSLEAHQAPPPNLQAKMEKALADKVTWTDLHGANVHLIDYGEE